ncbi:ArsR/SmtB family transcription factor [Halomarina ordinaria]|uniref:ArsR/SmtB family transcription factor n=1 Tax=Halomarina ordinaria TaxID=3033939 RepID=A0ABD5UHC8_9EURY|nr:helix-turn-helix domain-containing protein [Halomarina sp. PSRA2]
MTSITRLLSRRQSAKSIQQEKDAEPTVLAMDDESADEIFNALSSATTRSILTSLYKKPKTASEIGDEVDTSLQNINYHLTKLKENDLIEVADTWYSDQGKEMKVYTPSDEALVLFAGEDLTQSTVLSSIKNLIGIVAAFSIVSVLVDQLFRRFASSSSPISAGAGQSSSEVTTFMLPPGAIFFLGTLFAVVVFLCVRHYQEQHH